MSARNTVTPGIQLSPDETIDNAKLNLLGSPTNTTLFTFEEADNFTTLTEQTRTFTVTNIGNGEITLSSAHSLSVPTTVDDVRRCRLTNSGGDLPSGWRASTTYDYYIRPSSTNKFTLHSSPGGAVGAYDRVGPVDAGTGTHTIYWSNFNLGQPLIYNAATSKYEQGIVKRSGLPEMLAATSAVAGARGAVAQPNAGDQDKFLRGDASWATPTSAASSLILALLTR